MNHYLLFSEFDEKHMFIFSLVIGMEIGTDFQEKSQILILVLGFMVL